MEGTTNEIQNTNPRELEKILGEHSDIFRNPPHGGSIDIQMKPR